MPPPPPPGWSAPIPGAPHFTLAELCASNTAREYHLNNTPSPGQRRRLEHLARELLEPVRLRFGPMTVTSGFRSAELNWFVSLSRASRHCRGEAADLRPSRGQAGLWQVAAWVAAELEFHEVIVEHPPGGWLHLSLKEEGPQRRRLALQEPGRPLRELSPAELRSLAQATG